MRSITLCVLLVVLFVWSCNNSGTEPPPGDQQPRLTATPSSVTLVPSASTTVSLSGGTRPLTIISQPNGSVATASLGTPPNDTVLTVEAVNVGVTSVQVGDARSPRREVNIAITVATSAASIIFDR